MARQRTRVPAARKSDASRDDDSLLIRSAESLGRVIGSLQRQVQSSSKRISSVADDAIGAIPEMPRMKDLVGRARKSQQSQRKKTARKTTRGARKVGSASKRTAARKASSRKK